MVLTEDSSNPNISAEVRQIDENLIRRFGIILKVTNRKNEIKLAYLRNPV